MIIKRIDKTEIPAITKLAWEIWPAAYAGILEAEQIDYMLHSMYEPEVLNARLEKGNIFLMIYQNNTAQGFAEIELNYDAFYSKLHKIYVLPQLQGKGLGKALLKEALYMAIQYHQQGMYLNVNRFNSAKTFYEKQGFEVISEEDIDIGNHYFMNDYIMMLHF